MRVRTAVVPAAGLGTRFLPTTLAVPKELLPLDRKPAIHHIVQEAVEAGMDRVVLVLSRGKEAVLHYFLNNPEVAGHVESLELTALVDEVRELKSRVDLVAVYQEQALGLGHAVLAAAPAVGNEPFVLMLPDDHFRPSPLSELIRACEARGVGGMILKQVPESQVPRYGIVTAGSREGLLVEITGAVEKPPVEKAPSDLAILGRYVLPAEIFELLRSARPGVIGEIQLTDSLDRLASMRGMTGLVFEDVYLDLGTWDGFMLANAQACLARPELRARLKDLP